MADKNSQSLSLNMNSGRTDDFLKSLHRNQDLNSGAGDTDELAPSKLGSRAASREMFYQNQFDANSSLSSEEREHTPIVENKSQSLSSLKSHQDGTG